MARILIVDDEANVRIVLEQTLTSAGHRVVLAATGNEAMTRQRNTPADLAIIDIFMPDQDGLETITAFRRDFPQVPIIAMSGYDSTGAMLSMARKLGAARILDKPFESETIVSLVEDVLKSPK